MSGKKTGVSQLSDQVVFITGSAVGIGRGIATSYGKEGATVIAVDINQQGTKHHQYSPRPRQARSLLNRRSSHGL